MGNEAKERRISGQKDADTASNVLAKMLL